ncbi:MAG: PIN domain-containing protein [bacterium]|nr:PIN domain-containing protein [bacterium]
MVKLDLFINELLKAHRVALDSMIFIYLLERNEKYFSLVNIIFELLEKGKITGTTSIISPLEVLSSPKLSPDQISLYGRFFKEEQNLVTHELNWLITDFAAEIRRNYNLRTPDAIQLATAKLAGANMFISNDEIYKKILDIKNFPKICLLSSVV